MSYFMYGKTLRRSCGEKDLHSTADASVRILLNSISKQFVINNRRKDLAAQKMVKPLRSSENMKQIISKNT